ncbi:hypothetical protein JKF63_03777 [Porcisia hertigi]|uniref:CRAL-TRIO domain-containing protein n=1 Tax=Porcisia hertigi TaxID=2761500 RepID=A0A836LEY9_9TRYP|nr:hypothetical protein JKF63_03777 [Porcisia hertigi]
MFQCPDEHVEALDEVKRAVGIHHRYLDGWVYLFLANKNFNVAEAAAKLCRRNDMERTVFSKYTMTDSLRKSMRAGIVQYIGRDKEGRPVLYFNTARDSPKAEQRPERQANMDMFLSWSVRCDRKNPTATVTWLINQKNASLMRNTDLIFQKDMALRVSKFFPGVVARILVCNMSSALTLVIKPLLRQLPKAISDCIFLFSASDIKKGELLKRIDANVLPVEMGGCNDCDHAPNYERFAVTIEDYFSRCITALNQNISIKDMEVMEEFGVGKDGTPMAPAAEGAPDRSSRPAFATNSAFAVKETEAYGGVATLPSNIATLASEEMHVVATLQDPCTVTVDTGGQKITIQSTACRGPQQTSLAPFTHDNAAIDLSTSFKSLSLTRSQCTHRVPSCELFDCVSDMGDFTEDLVDSDTSTEGLYRIHLSGIEEFSYSAVLREMLTQRQSSDDLIAERWDACVRDWISFRCQCVELVPKLEHFLESLRLGAVLLADEEVTAKLRSCSHFMLNLFPQTQQTITFPLLDWYAMGTAARHRSGSAAAASQASNKKAGGSVVAEAFTGNARRLSFRLDCTSPDNVLLSAQAAAIEFVEEWDGLIEVEQCKKQVVGRLVRMGLPQADRGTVEAQLHCRAHRLWAKLVPLFRVYIEAKVGISIAGFIRHYGLLVSGGRIDETAEWYRQLFSAVLQYRELQRRNWLFYVFPPLGHGGERADEPPRMEDLLRAHGDAETDVDAAVRMMTLVTKSMRYTTDHFNAEGAGGVLATRTIVERYLESSKAKIYIPYEVQRTGVLPSESIERYRTAAVACLTDAEALLQEFLFAIVSSMMLKHGYPSDMSDAEIWSQLQLANAENAAAIQERYEQQRVAISFARVCSELQGSFGYDGMGILTTYPAASIQADGYELGLELLLAVAILKSRRSSSGIHGRVGKNSPAYAGLSSPVTASSEDKMPVQGVDGALREVTGALLVDTESLLRTLNAMSHSGSQLAALKRIFIY